MISVETLSTPGVLRQTLFGTDHRIIRPYSFANNFLQTRLSPKIDEKLKFGSPRPQDVT
jgi:hypothetical protein